MKGQATGTVPNGADKQTHKHLDKHGDCMTESAQWGQFSEKFRLRETKNLLTDADSSTDPFFCSPLPWQP